jgi:hypothetical protein
VTEPNKSQPTPPELETFLAGLHKVHSRDNQHVTEPHIVVHSTDAYWLTTEQTGNPSRIGLLRHLPMKTVEVLLRLIPAHSATDLQRHVHESVHFIIEGTG